MLPCSIGDISLPIADESVDGRIVHLLQELGYAVISIAKVSPGLPDDAVIDIAVGQRGYIITEDKDFGDELIYKGPHIKVPTLLLRLSGISIDEKKSRIRDIIEHHPDELKESFSVLSPHKLRVRRFE
jgi:predicted nuclease of predicted toxin-antitoxin system